MHTDAFGHFHPSLLFEIKLSYFCVELNYFCKIKVNFVNFTSSNCQKNCMKNWKDDPTFWCFAKGVVKAQKTLQFSWNIPQMPKSRATFWIFLPISPKSHYYECILEILEFFKKLISFCIGSCAEWIHKKGISVHW